MAAQRAETAAPSGEENLAAFDVKRRAILDGAAEVFYERGFTAGTTKEIAAKVGLSQPAIYHYVGSKDALLREIALQVDKDLSAALERALSASGDTRARLRAIVTEVTEAVVLNRKTFAVYYKEFHALQGETREKVTADERTFMARVVNVASAAQDEDALPKGHSPLVLAEAILGMVSWVHRWYRPTGPQRADDIAQAFIDLLGLRDGL